MPKVVDHHQRRREIGTAVLHVLASDGLEGLTVRKIAAESGWSTGVLAHYARDKESLIDLAIETMIDRFSGRIRRAVDEDRDDALRRVLHELLPLDAERRTEALVWFRLVTYDAAAPAMREGHRALRRLVAELLGADIPDAERKRLAAELIGLADGLAVHHLLDPRGMPRTRIIDALEPRIAALLTPAT